VILNDSTNINKMNIHLSPQHTEQNKTKTYDIGNPSPGLAQVQKCGRVQPVSIVYPVLMVEKIK
jgi:hypothetical protein